MLKEQLGAHATAHGLLENDGTLRTDSVPSPTIEELSHTYVAPGAAALLPMGITYQAHWKDPTDGMAKHARAQVRALAMTGMPVQLLAYGQHVMLDDELCDEAKRVSYLAGISCTHTAIAIKQLVPFSPQTLKDTLCPPGIRNYVSAEQVARIFSSTIFYTSWERDRCHPEYVELFNQLGQVWVPCKDNATAFISSGVDPERVKIVPCPYDPEDATIAAPRGEILPPVVSKAVRDKRFYNIGKWEPRKNQHQLIGAFLQAYTPKDRASLLIKTSGFGYGGWANYPTAEQSVQHWLDDEQVKAQGWTKAHLDRLVRIVEKKISEEDLLQLHKRNNIYVSAGLGEAWDLPAFTAKLSGNHLVYVGYGGAKDYAQADDTPIINHTKTRVHVGYGWEPDAQWAKVHNEAFVSALRHAAPKNARLVPTHFCSQYGMAAVGYHMAGHIEELARKLGVWSTLQLCGGFG